LLSEAPPGAPVKQGPYGRSAQGGLVLLVLKLCLIDNALNFRGYARYCLRLRLWLKSPGWF